MTVAELIDEAVMENLALYGCVKNLDPYALHLLKTSQHPILRGRRVWMRKQALKQCLDAEKQQAKLNSELAKIPHDKRMNMRQSASVAPYYAETMRRQHNAEWNDRDFIGFVKREEPAMFPRRE